MPVNLTIYRFRLCSFYSELLVVGQWRQAVRLSEGSKQVSLGQTRDVRDLLHGQGLGVIAFQKGKPKEAAKLLKQVVDGGSNDPGHLANYARALAATGQPDEAVRLVESGEYGIAFFLKPTKINEIKNMALKGDMMPQKSTYFYPKLLTGLVINKF